MVLLLPKHTENKQKSTKYKSLYNKILKPIHQLKRKNHFTTLNEHLQSLPNYRNLFAKNHTNLSYTQYGDVIRGNQFISIETNNSPLFFANEN